MQAYCPYCKKTIPNYQCYRGLHVWDCETCGYVAAADCDCDNSGLIEQARLRRLADDYDKALDVDRSKTFEAFSGDKQPRPYKKAQELISLWNSGAYMHGSPGTGKTHLATAILLEAVKAGKTAAFVDAVELSKLFGDALGYSEAKKDAEAEIERLIRADVLCIDDLGDLRKNVHDTFQEQIRFFLDSFSGCLLITTNHTTSEMLSLLGEKGQSRILGQCEDYEFIGDDMRWKK